MSKVNRGNLGKNTAPFEKHLQISEALRQSIKDGKYKDKIPSLKELVRMHGVCMITANKAVNTLVNEGLLYRQPGKGTFVNNGRRSVTQKLVGILMCASGHMYENLVRAIQNELQNKGFLTLIIDFTNIDEAQFPQRLEELLALNPEAIIFQAVHTSHGLFCSDYLSKNADKIKKMVIALDPECKGDLKAATVLSDSWHGGYIATKHLIDLGHRRILHLANSPHITPERLLPVDLYRLTYGYQRILGYRMAMEEKSLQEEIIYEDVDRRNFLNELEAAFRRKDRPTAVFARQDFVAVETYKLLRKFNLNVPDDVALVGYFNTPWSEMMDPPLTTVSIREEEIGRTIAETISKNIGILEQVLIKPELIVRESSGSVVRGR